jgi:MoaA/NifB/PqqE/SkfB family radical SAM enzyme
MVSAVKKTGAQVCTTTNGMLLDDQNITRLTASGIDMVAFSLAGIEEKNDHVRKGTQTKKVLQAVSELHTRKTALRIDYPRVNIAYLLLRSHLDEIDGIVPMLQGKGLNNVIISTLDFAPARELEDECLIPRTRREYGELKLILDRLVENGKRAGLTIRYLLTSPDSQTRSCPENIERALFVSADGAVSPCAFANIPGSGLYWRDGTGHVYNRMLFGSLRDTSLPVIWMGRRYSEFRNSFADSPVTFCRKCPKYSSL